MRTKKIPTGARHLRLCEMESYLHDFVKRRHKFIWLLGRPGTTKTERLRAALLGRPCCYLKGGQLTPLQFYINCYHHRGQPIILDDAEHLLDNKVGAKLVSSLGDTAPAKLLSYASSTRAWETCPRATVPRRR